MHAGSRKWPRSGESVKGSCTMVNADGLVWTNIPKSLRFNCDAFPRARMDIIYLCIDFGGGAKGHVFLACNQSGRACVVKLFIIDYST